MSVDSNPGLNWFCFTVLFDWSRKLAPPSQPIRCKLKPIAPWSLAFSRATGRLHAFTSSCHWLPLIISFTLIGRCDYFGFGFRHSIEKRSKQLDTLSTEVSPWCGETSFAEGSLELLTRRLRKLFITPFGRRLWRKILAPLNLLIVKVEIVLVHC